ncbi:hypothetical protein YB2330_002095 [Saitoella coloradoensis]
MSSDSVDRCFAHALATVRRIPGGPTRPPFADRLELYGLYKQATEGDVHGLMPRPTGNTDEEASARAKWDAWAAQAGLSKNEAKRRYISKLIDNMQRYASPHPATTELISELEFVWSQIKDAPASSATTSRESSPARSPEHLRFGSSSLGQYFRHSRTHTLAGDDAGPWEEGSNRMVGRGVVRTSTSRWKEDVERALEGLRVEVAALREELQASRAPPPPPPSSHASPLAKISKGFLMFLSKHALFDGIVLILAWLWFQKGEAFRGLLRRVFSDWLWAKILKARRKTRRQHAAA